MSSRYPVIDNRPIEQWKVTELKEELKRRKLMTKGLKDDLIRRLGEALQMERDAADKKGAVDEGSECIKVESGKEMDGQLEDVKEKPVEPHLVEDTSHGENKTQEVDETSVTIDISDKQDVNGKPVECQNVEYTVDDGQDKTQKMDDTAAIVDNDDERVDVETKSVESQMVEDAGEHSEGKTENVDESAITVDVNEGSVNPDEVQTQDGKLVGDNDSVMTDGEPVSVAVSVETSITVTETVVSQTSVFREESRDSDNQVKIEDPKLLHEHDILNVSDSNKQVSEVSSILGLKVNESISSDSVSINEKNELKDSLNANNFHLELEVVKPVTVEPSSNDSPPKGGNMPALAESMQCENQISVEETDDTNATSAELSRKIDIADGRSAEKLNLDRSSGDDSMEEDVLESKLVDSNHNPDDVKDRSGSHLDIVKEPSLVDTTAPNSCTDKDGAMKDNDSHAAAAEKRKFEGKIVAENSEPPKRQRRWNSEAPKVSEPPNSTLTPTTPKDTFRSAIPKSNFSRSDSTTSSGADPPKERVVPQSSKPPTNSLRIDRFLRPFTLKAVQELLAKTGTISSFWMDHIKTHCYVTFSSVEEAKETRNAVYNLQWPPNGGHLLVAEFVEPEEVKSRAEATSQQAGPIVSNSPTTPAGLTPSLSKPLPRQHLLKEQLPPPASLPPPPPLSQPRQHFQKESLPSPVSLPPPPPPPARERVQLPPPPPLAAKADIPILTLDDLFKKTNATPRIYYLPLSEEQVAAKIAAQRNKNM